MYRGGQVRVLPEPARWCPRQPGGTDSQNSQVGGALHLLTQEVLVKTVPRFVRAWMRVHVDKARQDPTLDIECGLTSYPFHPYPAYSQQADRISAGKNTTTHREPRICHTIILPAGARRNHPPSRRPGQCATGHAQRRPTAMGLEFTPAHGSATTAAFP